MNRFKDVKPPEVQAFINQPLKESGISSNINVNKIRDIDTDIGLGIDTNKQGLSLEAYNPRAIKKKIFNVRLNDYYLAALRQLAKPDEGISMQKIAREILENGLDALIAQHGKK